MSRCRQVGQLKSICVVKSKMAGRGGVGHWTFDSSEDLFFKEKDVQFLEFAYGLFCVLRFLIDFFRERRGERGREEH